MYQSKREILTPVLHDAFSKVAKNHGVSMSDLFNTATEDLCLILVDLFDDVPMGLSSSLTEAFVKVKNKREGIPDMIRHMRGQD
jgi:hypothetical protein